MDINKYPSKRFANEVVGERCFDSRFMHSSQDSIPSSASGPAHFPLCPFFNSLLIAEMAGSFSLSDLGLEFFACDGALFSCSSVIAFIS